MAVEKGFSPEQDISNEWMSHPQNVEVKKVNGVEFLKFTYDFCFSPENRERLKVIDRMPFNIFIKRSEQNFSSGKNSPEKLVKELLDVVGSGCDYNFFWHGFGADKEIWNRRIENEIISQESNNQIYVAADGLSMGEKEDNPYPNEFGRFDPIDYAEQISVFTELFFKKDFKYSKNTGSVTVSGHSFGGIALLWAIPKLSDLFGEEREVNYVAYHPAYPGEANIFLTSNYMRKIYKLLGKISADTFGENNSQSQLTLIKLLEFSRHIPKPIRTSIIGRLVYEIIHRPLLGEDQGNRKRHSQNAGRKPLTLLAGARGLLNQSELSESDKDDILHYLKKHQLIIFTSPDDNIVSELEFKKAFGSILDQAKEVGANIHHFSIPGGHYLFCMNNSFKVVLDYLKKSISYQP